MWSLRRVAVVLVAGAISRPLVAFAEPSAVRIAYFAAEGCPTGEQFSAAVAARGRNVVAVDDETPATIRVSIAADRGGYRGTLHMGPSADGAREVHGASCRDVVDALAVVTVSSLGPAEATAASTTTRNLPASAPVPSEEAGQPQRPAAPAVAPVIPRGGAVSAVPDELPVAAGTLKFERDNAMTVFAGAKTGLIPSVPLPWLQFEFSRTNLVASPDGRRYRELPTVRLHGDLSLVGKYVSRYGTTEANGLGAGADLCAPLHYDETGFEVLLCAEFMIGYFGLRTTNPQGVAGPVHLEGVGTAGLGLELAYNIGRHFHLGLKAGGAGVAGPLSAQASDGSTIFQSSRVSLYVMLGAGGNF